MTAMVTFILFFSVAPASASAATAAEDHPKSDIAGVEIAEYTRDLGVPPQIAEENLLLQQRGAGIVELLRSVLNGAFAGVWFDHERGQFVVPVIAGGNSSTLQRALRDLGLLSGDYRLERASASWEQLEGTQERVISLVEGPAQAGLVKTMLSAKANAVVLQQAKLLGASDEAEISRIAAREPEVVTSRSQRPRFKMATEACTTSEPRTCDKPLRGGAAIGPTIPTGGGSFTYAAGLCTAGFKAIGNVYGNRFILTAGHCAHQAPSQIWASETTISNIITIGNVEEYSFGPTGEWAKIRANGSGWDTASWPSLVTHYWGNQSYPILYEGWSYQGQYVCFSGNRSGTSCGAVRNLQVTGLYDEISGTFLPPLTEVPGICQIGGDSGGPLFSFSSNMALGMLSGGEGGPDCAQEVAYFAEITAATTAMGVSVGQRIGGPPSAATEPAIYVADRTYALHGQVNPNGVQTSYRFEYGPTTAYGQSAPVPDGSVGNGTGNVKVSQTVGNLASGTTYNYRLIARSAAGVSYGPNYQFTTASEPPLIDLQPATDIGRRSATLRALVDTRGKPGGFRFWYGLSDFDTATPPTAVPAGSGWVEVKAKVDGLLPGTTYRFRVAVWNADGGSTGGQYGNVFTTLSTDPTYSAQMQPSGPGAGLAGEVVGFDLDEEGNLWAANPARDRIERFTPGGAYLGSFGTQGSAAGQLNDPTDVAVGPDGNLWVADFGNGRVQKFTPNGQLLFVAGVREGNLNADMLKAPYGIAVGPGLSEVFTTDYGNCAVVQLKEGSGGMYGRVLAVYKGIDSQRCTSAPGDFLEPTGLSVAPNGDVWIADTGNSRVTRLTAINPPLRYGWNVYGEPGTGAGQYAEPLDVEVTPRGTPLVLDAGNARVQALSGTGAFGYQFGALGSGPGQFSSPKALAARRGGRIYVLDSGNGRFAIWNQAGAPEATTGAANSVTRSAAELTAVVNPHGAATGVRFEYGTSTAYGSFQPTAPIAVGAGDGPVPVSQTVSGLAPGTVYHYRVVAVNEEGTVTGVDRTFTTAP